MPTTVTWNQLNGNLRRLAHNLLANESNPPAANACGYAVTDPTDPDRQLVAIYGPDGALLYEEPDGNDTDGGSWWDDYQRYLSEEYHATHIKVFS
jgi:hypothetical protein